MRIEKAQSKAENMFGPRGFAIFDIDEKSYLIGKEINGELLIYGNSDISWEDAIDRAKKTLNGEDND